MSTTTALHDFIDGELVQSDDSTTGRSLVAAGDRTHVKRVMRTCC